MTLRARTAQEVLPWLLSWGAAAQVLSPAPLQARLRDEGRRLAQRYT
ncbi:WYL domain-containing protein [Deinococcus petrolearius]|uniref:WYL domain-containing protein n=1 Tax=Deinococcus petrolearius TaxID=1751295 RepID=A0ABW1DGR6_9DEIO